MRAIATRAAAAGAATAGAAADAADAAKASGQMLGKHARSLWQRNRYQKKKKLTLDGLEHPWPHSQAPVLTTLIAAHLHGMTN